MMRRSAHHLPYHSLALLWLAYSVLGYVLEQILPLLGILLVIVGLIGAELLALTAFFSRLRKAINTWTSRDFTHLMVILTAAFFLSVALVWYHIFENVMLIFAAELLIRLDLRNVNWSRLQIFTVSTVILLSGCLVGWSVGHFLVNDSTGV